MRVRYQSGCIRLTNRKSGTPWEFLWRENDVNGKRARRTAVIGTVDQFPPKSAHILYDRIRGEFRLAFVPPCHAVTCFHKADLRPYSVSAGILERGYARIGDCRPIGEINAGGNP